MHRRVVREPRLWCRNLPEARNIETMLFHWKLTLQTQELIGSGRGWSGGAMVLG